MSQKLPSMHVSCIVRGLPQYASPQASIVAADAPFSESYDTAPSWYDVK